MLSLLFGVPVDVTLAGQLYRVRQYRLIDLARLESWALARLEGPSVAIEMALSATDGEERDEYLRKASDMAKHIPMYGSERIRMQLGTLDGIACQLRTGIVRRRRRRMTWDESTNLAARITIPDWLRFSRVAYGIHPLDEVSSAIDMVLGVPPDDSVAEMDYRKWREAIRRAAEFGIPPHVLPYIPLRLWDAALSGKIGAHPVAEPDEPDPDRWDEISEIRDRFWRGWHGNGHEDEVSNDV